jgi:protein TonB
MEYYLGVLAKEPNNIQATQALVDIFPISVNVTERAIAQKQIDEADRMLGLLDKASPKSYTVTTVRAKLEAARAVQTREQATLAAQQASQQQAQQLAQQQAVAQKTADAQAAAAAKAAAAAPAKEPEKAVASAAPPPVQTAPPPPAPAAEPAAAPSGESREATVVRKVPPEYPPDAYRKRQEGWVELEFVVGPDGRVGEVTVSKAQPARVFDKEAIRAMQQWTFQPALKDGKPTEARLKRRMEFKMGG